MAIHSSILAWRIPLTEGCPPWGGRVGHNCTTFSLSQGLCCTHEGINAYRLRLSKIQSISIQSLPFHPSTTSIRIGCLEGKCEKILWAEMGNDSLDSNVMPTPHCLKQSKYSSFFFSPFPSNGHRAYGKYLMSHSHSGYSYCPQQASWNLCPC